MINDNNTGIGRVTPLDTPEFGEMSVVVQGETIVSASYACSENEYLQMCLKTLCEVLKDKPAIDVFQINNNCIYYNLPVDLPRNQLYCASIAVLSAKRAIADWCKKNAIDVPDMGCHCV